MVRRSTSAVVSSQSAKAHLSAEAILQWSATIATVLQIFLDGSGRSDDPHCLFLTLAGVLAEEQVWNEWSERWRMILGEHGVEYSHMRELLRGKGPFHDWDNERKRKFVLALLQSLSFKDRMKLIYTSLTIDLTGYWRLAVRPDIKPPEAVCVDFCLSHLFAHPNFGSEKAEVAFDRGEKFERYLNYTWTRNKSDQASWASHVRIAKPSDMKVTLPIQAADLFAWAANRNYTSDEDQTSTWTCLLAMSIVALPCYHSIYREAELVNHPGFYGWPDGTSVSG